MMAPEITREEKYIHFRGEIITIRRDKDDFWVDDNGTLYAYYEVSATTDPVNRCGVAPFALPMWAVFQPLNDACGPHDFCYSSPVYQAFHNRSEADEYLDSLVTQATGSKVIGEVVECAVRLGGARWWENEETKNK